MTHFQYEIYLYNIFFWITFTIMEMFFEGLYEYALLSLNIRRTILISKCALKKKKKNREKHTENIYWFHSWTTLFGEIYILKSYLIFEKCVQVFNTNLFSTINCLLWNYCKSIALISLALKYDPNTLLLKSYRTVN